MTDVFDPARLDAIRSRQVFDKARERGMTQTTVRALAQAIAKRLGENGADFISETDADSTIEEMIAAWLAYEPTPDARAENSFHALTRKCDQHQEQWCRLCGPGVIASAIARATAASEARVRELEEVAKDLLAHLVATVSLLERGGKKAAPSNKMFEQMMVDYQNSINRGRRALGDAR